MGRLHTEKFVEHFTGMSDGPVIFIDPVGLTKILQSAFPLPLPSMFDIPSSDENLQEGPHT